MMVKSVAIRADEYIHLAASSWAPDVSKTHKHHGMLILLDALQMGRDFTQRHPGSDGKPREV